MHDWDSTGKTNPFGTVDDLSIHLLTCHNALVSKEYPTKSSCPTSLYRPLYRFQEEKTEGVSSCIEQPFGENVQLCCMYYLELDASYLR